jgi:hypothetical protein
MGRIFPYISLAFITMQQRVKKIMSGKIVLEIFPRKIVL